MQHSKPLSYFLSLGLICLVSISSCRKKDERYEGNYVGTERHIYRDSGATMNSIDTTYAQEVQVTYSNAVIPRRKRYDFTEVNGNQDQFSISKKSIIDHKHQPWNTPGYVIFSGDSIYIYQTNFSDHIENWDTETWEFKGKRN